MGDVMQVRIPLTDQQVAGFTAHLKSRADADMRWQSYVSCLLDSAGIAGGAVSGTEGNDLVVEVEDPKDDPAVDG